MTSAAISPSALHVLTRIRDEGPAVPESGMDPEVISELVEMNLIRRLGGFATMTGEGRQMLHSGAGKGPRKTGSLPAAIPVARPDDKAFSRGIENGRSGAVNQETRTPMNGSLRQGTEVRESKEQRVDQDASPRPSNGAAAENDAPVRSIPQMKVLKAIRSAKGGLDAEELHIRTRKLLLDRRLIEVREGRLFLTDAGESALPKRRRRKAPAAEVLPQSEEASPPENPSPAVRSQPQMKVLKAIKAAKGGMAAQDVHVRTRNLLLGRGLIELRQDRAYLTAEGEAALPTRRRGRATRAAAKTSPKQPSSPAKPVVASPRRVILSDLQWAALATLAEAGGTMPRQALDGRTVIGLVHHQVVSRKGDIVQMTDLGWDAIGGEPSPEPPIVAEQEAGKLRSAMVLSDAQERWMRQLAEAGGSIALETADKRVAQALGRKGLAERQNERLHLTPAGRARMGLGEKDATTTEAAPDLPPKQAELLEQLEREGAQPRSAVDGRSLRGLIRRGLAEADETEVRPVSVAMAAAPHESPGGEQEPSEQVRASLPPKQVELLERLEREGPQPRGAVDGRSLRGLLRRGLAEADDTEVRAVSEAAAAPSRAAAELAPAETQDPAETQPAPGETHPEPAESAPDLSDAQAVLLARMQQAQVAAVEGVDKRSLGALARKGLLQRSGGSVRLTSEGAAYEIAQHVLEKARAYPPLTPAERAKARPARKAKAQKSEPQPVTPPQEALLRQVAAAGGSMLSAVLNRVSLNPIIRRHWLREDDGVVSFTSKGKLLAETLGIVIAEHGSASSPRADDARAQVEQIERLLSPRQRDLLMYLGRTAETPHPDQVDQRTRSALEARGYARVSGEGVALTERGRTAYNLMVASGITAPARGGRRRRAAAVRPPHDLNDKQRDLLRQLVLSDHAVPEEDVDGRSLASLVRIGLAVQNEGLVLPTEEGSAFFNRYVRRHRTVRRAASGAGRKARHEAILLAIEHLQRALPVESVFQVKACVADVPEMLGSLRELAERFARGADVSRLR